MITTSKNNATAFYNRVLVYVLIVPAIVPLNMFR